MNPRKRAIILLSVLLVICGLLIWHAISWQVSGMYQEMFRWLGSTKAYLTVLYNIGFMMVLGFILGMLLAFRITQIRRPREMAIMQVNIVPVGTLTPSVSQYVAGVVRILQGEPGIKYELTATGTIIEGELENC